MSYILDALKKADSERQHGKMPDIYSNQPHNDALEKEESDWNKPIVWLLAVLIILLMAFLVYINLYRISPAGALPSAQVAPPTVQNTPSSTVAQTVPIAVPAVVPVPAAAAVENTPAPITAPAEPVKLQPSQKLSAPAAKEKHENHEKHEKRPASASKPSAAKKASVTKESDLAIETVSTTFRDLPLNIQNEIPTVTVGGYIYSANRTECQLLINKLLLHEGEQVAPGLTLERMMPHSAILNYKGYRYRISY